MRPQVLGANQPLDRFYAGGRRIAAFRGDPPVDRNVPEDWVASTTTLFGEPDIGLSREDRTPILPDRVGGSPGVSGHQIRSASALAYGIDEQLVDIGRPAGGCAEWNRRPSP